MEVLKLLSAVWSFLWNSQEIHVILIVVLMGEITKLVNRQLLGKTITIFKRVIKINLLTNQKLVGIFLWSMLPIYAYVRITNMSVLLCLLSFSASIGFYEFFTRIIIGLFKYVRGKIRL